MDERLLQLAFAMHNSPGLYALLLGSGISRAAEIPTGWEITLDLIRQVVAVMGEDADDPEEWYASKFGEEPDYSRVIERLAKTPAERNKLLRPYFVPTPEELEEGIKQPTQAHRDIAWLVKQGYIKVILTTNFDRLIEQALEAEGVTPDVYSTDDQFASMSPMQHSDAVVIKLHGDYLDWRIKNSEVELAEYDPVLAELLRRIFSEYGLIIGGWSGDYDTALRETLMVPANPRAPRFGTYWLAHTGVTGTRALEIIETRNAHALSINGAEQFFDELRNSVEALTRLSADRALELSVLVERAKKYLRRSESSIDLEELLREEVEVAYRAVTNEDFKRQLDSQTNEIRRWELYFKPMERVLHLLAAIGWYGDEKHARLVIQAIERLDCPASSICSTRHKFIPAILTWYALGIPALKQHKWYFLNAIMKQARFQIPTTRAYASAVKVISESLILDTQRSTPTLPAFQSVVEACFETELRELLGGYLPKEQDFTQYFDLFEMIESLLYLAIRSESQRMVWTPTHMALVGRSSSFLEDFWRRVDITSRLLAEYFETDDQSLLSTLQEYDEFARAVSRKTLLGIDLPSYELVYSQSLGT